MWSIPQAVAERQALVKQRELQKKLYQLNSPCTVLEVFNLHEVYKRGSHLRDITLLLLFVVGSVMTLVLSG